MTRDAVTVGAVTRDAVTVGAVTRDAVAVVGPARSGTTGLAAALASRLPSHPVLEVDRLGPGDRPAVVVFVVSSAAPMTASQAVLLDNAASTTDAVVAVVSKIDVHRTWPQVLAANRAHLQRLDGRHRATAWLGVAAAPEVGPPRLDELVDAVRAMLARSDLERRNMLRARHSQLSSRIRDCERGAAVRRSHAAVLRQRLQIRTERAIAVRAGLRQVRLHLSGHVRSQCVALRTELQQSAVAASPDRVERFCREAGRRAAELCGDLDRAVVDQLSSVEQGCGLALASGWDSGLASATRPGLEVSVPPPHRGGLEDRLAVLLGAGFGLGAAVTLQRVVSALAPRWTALAVAGCLTLGAVLGWWVVRIRRSLSTRAALDRWATEFAASLRAALDERVAAALLAAEAAWNAAAAGQDAREHHDPDLTVVDQRLSALRAELAAVAGQLAELSEPFAAEAAADRTYSD